MRRPRLPTLIALALLSACQHGPQLQKSTGLEGVWQCAPVGPDVSTSELGAVPAGLSVIYADGSTGHQHRFTGSEYAIFGPEGLQEHHWKYKLHDSLLIVASDTAVLHWTTGDEFLLATGGTSWRFLRHVSLGP